MDRLPENRIRPGRPWDSCSGPQLQGRPHRRRRDRRQTAEDPAVANSYRQTLCARSHRSPQALETWRELVAEAVVSFLQLELLTLQRSSTRQGKHGERRLGRTTYPYSNPDFSWRVDT